MKTFLHVLLGGVIGGVLVALLGSNGYMGRYSFVTQDVVTDGGKYLGDTNTNLSLGGDGMGGVGTDGSNDLKGGTDGGDGGGGEEMMAEASCADDVRTDGASNIGKKSKIQVGDFGRYYCNNLYTQGIPPETYQGRTYTLPGINITNGLYHADYYNNGDRQSQDIYGKTPGKHILTCKFATQGGQNLSCPYEIEVLRPSCSIVFNNLYDIKYTLSNLSDSLFSCKMSMDGKILDDKFRKGQKNGIDILSFLGQKTIIGRYSIVCGYDLGRGDGRQQLCQSNDYYNSNKESCPIVKINNIPRSNLIIPQEFPIGEQPLTISCEGGKTPIITPALKKGFIDEDTIHHISCPYNNGTKSCDLFIKTKVQCGDGSINKGEQCEIGKEGVCKGPGYKGCNIKTCMCEIETTNVIEEKKIGDNGGGASGPSCGNGNQDEGEECDDGNNLDNDQCSNLCQKTYCDDGIVQSKNGYNEIEECDKGANNKNGGDNLCNEQCKFNPTINGSCAGTNNLYDFDDGGNMWTKANFSSMCNSNNIGMNSELYIDWGGHTKNKLGFTNEWKWSCKGTQNTNIKGTTAMCKKIEEYCKDGIKNGSEKCDDGNDSNTDQCNNLCQETYCGDKIVQSPNGQSQYEQCDMGPKGGTIPNSGGKSCTKTCELK